MSEADYLVGVEEYELAFVEDVLDDAPVDAQTVYKETIDMSERAIAAEAAFRTTSGGGGGGGAPSGPAGGVLGGTYPNPSFAADMATQAELDALSAQAVILAPAASARNVIQPTAGSVIAAVVKAHAAQSVDLTRWTSSADAVWAAFDSVGTLNLSPAAGQPGLVITRGDTEDLDIVRVFAGARLIFDMYQWQDGAEWVTEFDLADDAIAGSSKVLYQSNRHMLLRDAAGSAGNVFQVNSYAGVRKFSIFVPTAVVQQSASSVGALWTALKNYGWLDAGSAAPSVYTPGGTDVALADGGTGVSLTDPNADRILFWDDSAGAVTWLTPGTNLTITGTTIDAAAGAAAPLPKLSQQWYVPVPIYAAAVTAPTQSRLLLSPLELPAGITLDRIAINQFGGGVASCVFRMGIYSDVGTMYPGALLLDAGTVDLSTAAAVKSITIAQAISAPGVYWVGGVAQGAAPPTILCVGSGAQEGADRMPVDPGTLFNKSVAFYEAGVTGALPANFTSTVNFTSVNAPNVAVRVQ